MSSYEEWLFAGTLDDLKQKLESKNGYQALMCSGLLRKLLLDGGQSLLHQVNAQHRLPIQFVHTLPAPPGPGTATEVWGIMDSFDPETSRPERATSASRVEGFLAQPILQVGDDVFKVRDVIRHLANVMGGVHLGEPRSREDYVLVGLAGLSVGGAPALVRSILSVSRITHRALLPLRQHLVELDKGADGPPVA